MSALRIERIYAHPRERVWHALTDSDLMAQWLMPNDFEPRVGHRFTFRTDPAPGFDGIVRCEVRVIDELKCLSFSWQGGPIDTIVTFTLEDAAEGTRLVMVQDGFAGIKGWMVRRLLGRGWGKILGRLLPEAIESAHAAPA